MKHVMIALSIVIGLFAASSQAASPCKGKSQSACSSAAQCHWVDAYKRKDGVSVKAHCRTSAKGAKNILDKKAKQTKQKASKAKHDAKTSMKKKKDKMKSKMKHDHKK